MKFTNRYLDKLSNDQSKILVFDCEFWHVLGETGDNGYAFDNDKDFFFMPREIGGFMLIKQKDGSWLYKDPFFVSMSKPKRDVAFPISHFATVSRQTGVKLDELELDLGLPWGDAFPSRLSDEGKRAHAEAIKIYELDSNIKKHHKAPSWYKTFIKHYSESTIIVKGTNDIDALKNAAKHYGFQYQDPKDIVDIAVWNVQSRKRCRTAKLEGTYLCIERKLDKETQEIAKHLPLEKAHDPTTDASMTLLVALYIESQKP